MLIVSMVDHLLGRQRQEDCKFKGKVSQTVSKTKYKHEKKKTKVRHLIWSLVGWSY
jgi:hypothetical protein